MERLEDFSMEKAIEAGTVDALELVEARARRAIKVIFENGYNFKIVPNIIICNSLRMLREAIEWWEAEQGEVSDETN